jgi:hypothetical protein
VRFFIGSRRAPVRVQRFTYLIIVHGMLQMRFDVYDDLPVRFVARSFAIW